MAKEKKSFLMYCDLIHTVEKMPDDKAGQLLKHLLRYVNDLNPITDDILIELTFEPIKQQLKRDLNKWSEIREEKSMGGRMGNIKRWHPDLYKKIQDGIMDITEAESIASHRRTSHTDNMGSHRVANIAVNDTVTVTVNDTVKVNDILLEKETKEIRFNFKAELLKVSGDKDLVNEWIDVRKAKKLTNSKTALESFMSEVTKSNLPINDILRKCVIRSWGGFESKWLTNSPQVNSVNNGYVISKSGNKIDPNAL